MKTKYLAFAAAALMLASCSNDEDFVPQDNLKDTPITVSAAVEGMLTRAGHDADNLPAKFYLNITQDTEDATSKYNYTNVLMTKAEDDNTYSAPEGTTLLWKDSNRDVAVNAYTTDAETFTVKTDQSTEDGVLASDLLGAVKADENSDISVGGDNITINFRHLLCKLDVTFSWGTELNAATEKSIKSVTYQNFGTDVTLDRATCTVTDGENTADITALVTNMTSEAIFGPQTSGPKIIITALINNEERRFSLNVTAPTDGFVSGNRYTMNVTIGGTSVEVTGVSSGQWVSSTGDELVTE